MTDTTPPDRVDDTQEALLDQVQRTLTNVLSLLGTDEQAARRPAGLGERAYMDYLDHHARFLSYYGEYLQELSSTLRRFARVQEIRLRRSGEWGKPAPPSRYTPPEERRG